MRLGDLKHNCIFQAPVKNSTGVSWETVFTCKGAYWPLNSSEQIAALAAGSSITGKVRIAYRPVRISSKWRVLCENYVLGIAAPPINLGGENKWLEMKVTEIL
jgi:SPP1 family predicted phage head-tail adaptor